MKIVRVNIRLLGKFLSPRINMDLSDFWLKIFGEAQGTVGNAPYIFPHSKLI